MFRMKLVIVVTAAALLLGCRDQAPDPDAAWVATWNLVAVNGQSLPVSISWNGVQRTVEDQALFANANHSGLWVSIAGTGIGGSATVSWSVSGNVMTVNTASGSGEGHVPNAWQFTKQGDGSLARTENGHSFSYRRN